MAGWHAPRSCGHARLGGMFHACVGMLGSWRQLHPQPPSSVDTTDFHYDKAGNVILDDKRFYKYDAWNRVARVSERGTLAVSGDTFTGAVGDLLSIFFYDALGRRINKRVYNSEALNTTGYGDYFYYDGHRVLEHRKTNASDTAVEPHRRYVYGLDYIDEVVAYYDTGAADPDPHFVLQDANYDVVGVTDHTGILEQQYSYAPYGAYQHIEDGSGNAEGNGPADLTELLIPLGRNGLFLDRETGLYYNRARYYDPLLSRFLQADPNGTGLVLQVARAQRARNRSIGLLVDARRQYDDGIGIYQYAQSRPTIWSDPYGERTFTYELNSPQTPAGLSLYGRLEVTKESCCAEAAVFVAAEWQPPGLHYVKKPLNWMNVHLEFGARGGVKGSVRACASGCVRDIKLCGRYEVFGRVDYRRKGVREDWGRGRFTRMRFGVGADGGGEICYNLCNGAVTASGQISWWAYAHPDSLPRSGG